MYVSWWALNPDGTYDVPLPDVISWTLSPVSGSPGAVDLTYPVAGRHFDVLRDQVTRDSDLEVAVWITGGDVGSLRAYLNTTDLDDVAESGVAAFSGNFLAVRMEEACVAPRTEVVQPPTGPAPTTDLASFRVYAATAGTVMGTLMQEAQTRGALDDLVWNFTGAVDSLGVPWSKTITLKIAPGSTHLKVLESLVSAELCEWDVVWNGEARELVMWEAGTRGVDHTTTPVPLILRAGRDLTESPRKHSVRDAGTHLLLAGGEGLYQVTSDPTAFARRGRRIERFNSQGSYTDPGSLAAFGVVKLREVVTGVLEVGHGVALEPGGPRPLIDYRVGDLVFSDTGRGLESLRIAQLTVTGDQEGLVSAGLSLNDLISSDVEALSKRIDGIEGGTTVTGTSNPPDEGPEELDTMPPAAPQGVVVDSEAQPSPELVPRSAVFATWAEVVTNADQTIIDDLAGYVVQWRYLNPDLVTNWRQLAQVDTNAANWSEVVAGEAIEVRVAAADTSNNQSAWSTPSGFATTETDGTAPPIPSALDASEFLGTLTVEWDGIGAAGEPMPRDFDAARIFRGESANFGDAVFVESMAGPGARNYTDLPIGVTQFFWLTTVDRSGNESDPSAAGTATPARIGFGDIAFTNPGNFVEDGSFELAGSRATHQARSNPAWSFVEGGAEHGEWHARGNGATGTGTRQLVLSGLVPTVPDDQVAFRFALRRNTANGPVSARIRWFDAAGTAIIDNLLTYTTTEPTGVWTEKEVSPYTAPAAATAFQIVFALEASCTSGSWDVDRVEVREMLGTLLIQAAAITDAKIANASVGKLTAGTITAIMLMAGMLRSAASGQRYELDASGLRFYDASNNLVIDLNRLTASAMLTGTFQSGRTGRRVLVSGGSNEIRFMPQTGETRFAAVKSYVPANYPNDIAIDVKASDADTLDIVSRLSVTPDFCDLNVSDQDDQANAWSRCRINRTFAALQLFSSPGVKSTDVELTAGLVSLSTRRSNQDRATWIYGFDDGNGTLSCQMRAGFTEDSGARGEVFVGNNSFARLGLVSGSSRWGFEYTGSIGLASVRAAVACQVIDQTSSAFRPIRASAFEVNSEAANKDEFEALPGSALAVLRGAPITRWRYLGDRDDSARHVGPVADDLPDWVKLPRRGPATDVRVVDGPTVVDGEGNPVPGPARTEEGTSTLPDSEAVDLASMVGLLMEAVREIDAELDEFRRERGRPVPTRRKAADLLDDIRNNRLPSREGGRRAPRP